MKKTLRVKFALHTRTPGNSRRHWRADWRDAKHQRETVACGLRAEGALPPLPVRVQLTRLGPRKLDKHNTWGALKHVIDGIADAYGIDDSDDRLDIPQPLQERAPSHAVEVFLETKKPAYEDSEYKDQKTALP